MYRAWIHEFAKPKWLCASVKSRRDARMKQGNLVERHL